MNISEFMFWLFAVIVVYSYLGYGLLIYLILVFVRLFRSDAKPDSLHKELPEVTLLVAAYNEEEWIEEKIRNCLELEYPPVKLKLWFVTDGSSDRTTELIKNYPVPENVKLEIFHEPERRGKIAAIERVLPFVKTPIIVFTDANTRINPEAVKRIVQHYSNPLVGAVAGEKRIESKNPGAAGSGESVYWLYESTLKNWDSELYSVVGAAGELFSIRTHLFEGVEKDTLIEDFVMTVRIAMKGFRVVYEPDAFAIEAPSANVKEEWKRKVRIGAGGLQAGWRLRKLLNIFKYRTFAFQYISHRLLRWAVTPLLLPVLFVLNVHLVMQSEHAFYQLLLIGQMLFYLFALSGWLLEEKNLRYRLVYLPYYFCMMNLAMYWGFFRLIKGKQSVVWEKAARSKNTHTGKQV